MKQFLGDDFLLNSELAVKLYNEVKDLGIIDYHCHLNPEEIAENKRYRNIAEMWLGGDHYKWRLMRADGVTEEYITGDAPDYEKFLKWAAVVENLIGSPLYHWTHLELRRYFGYDGLLSKKTAPEIWEHCNMVIGDKNFSVWSILNRFNVEHICTTDDPIDDLHHHGTIKLKNKSGGIKTKVYPTFRPSKAFAIEDPSFVEYIDKLSRVSGIAISDYESLTNALYSRMEYFKDMGCFLSDNSLEPPVYTAYDRQSANIALLKALGGNVPETRESNSFKSTLFTDLGKRYYTLGWTMQLHINALRNNNSAMYKILGPDTGFDSISDTPVAAPLSGLLNSLADADGLPKTIIYTLNPGADDVISAMTGNFQGGTKARIQFGSAWWFNDTKSGMEKHMRTVANHGMLAHFIGMLTDSRSFLSFTRHEYFRRIMVNLLAEWVTNGEFPHDYEKLRDIATSISYHNAKNYFSL